VDAKTPAVKQYNGRAERRGSGFLLQIKKPQPVEGSLRRENVAFLGQHLTPTGVMRLT
jgi:hypothetical protein